MIPTIPVGSSSEAREINVSRSVYEKHEILLPLRNGIVPSKPPFFHWLVAVVSKIRGGVTRATTRSVSLIASTTILFITILISSKIRPDLPFNSHIFSGVLLGLNYTWLRLALDARVDMLFSMLVLLACYGPVSALYEKKKLTGIHWFFFFLFSGLSVLTKGLLGIFLPCLFLFFPLCLFSGFKSTVKIFLSSWPFWILFVFVSFPWYILAAQKGSEGFLWRHIFFEHLQRITGSEHMNSRSFFYYFMEFPRAIFPWSLIFLFSIPSIIKSGLKTPKSSHNLLGILVIVTMLLFSIPSGKRFTYLCPVLPFFCIYLSCFLSDWFKNSEDKTQGLISNLIRRFMGILPILFITLALFVEIAIQPYNVSNIVLTESIGHVSRYRFHYQAFLIVAFVLALMAHSRLFRPEKFKIILLSACTIALFSFLIFVPTGIKNSLKDFERTAGDIAKTVENKPVSVVKDFFDESFDVILYLLARDVVFIDPLSRIDTCEGFLLAKQSWIQSNSQLLDGAGMSVVKKYVEIYKRDSKNTGVGISLIKCKNN